MSQYFTIERLDKRKWFQKVGIGKVACQDKVLYHGGYTRRGFTFSDPVSEQLVLSCEPEGSWWDFFIGRGAQVFKKDQEEVCRIQCSVKKLSGELIIADKKLSLKPICGKDDFGKRFRRHEWGNSTLELSYDENYMCMAFLTVEKDIDPFPYIAISYYLWMQEDYSD